MIVKWMHLFGISRIYEYDCQKASQVLRSLNYEMEDSYKANCDKEASAEFFTNESKTLAFAMMEIFGNDSDIIIPFYGLVINRRNVVKKFDGDVDSGYSDYRQVNTNPQKHAIRHCEVIYRKHNAIKGVLLVTPPGDYIYRQQVLSLHGIVKAYALRHGLKIYTGGVEMISESYK